MRHASLAEIHAAANHPDVLPHSAPGFDSVDLAYFYTLNLNKAFGDARGVILLAYQGDNTYEWHWVLTPAIRGAAALYFGKTVLREMFTRHNACAIEGLVPRDHRAARLMNRALGARPVCYGSATILYRLERSEWADFSADSSAVPVQL